MIGMLRRNARSAREIWIGIMNDDHAAIVTQARGFAAAIAARDAAVIESILAPEFVLRRPGMSCVQRAEFVAALIAIPVEITFVRLEQVDVDVMGDGALVTGIQHSQVRVDGETLEERRPFADWFVRGAAGRWLLQGAVEIAPLRG
jgi:ketosteroid isomerase-like protein